ncbi:hypothetical protein B0T21DRAFT_351600 [Apiosordaria backusii]|uniref:Uncharacterized protein n=1 Tax=Apiosordaria backusii TaxID=314023 RepID=A0AA40DYX1_9PEZI|nr:hypothetical protein B0T21DRAFT_351600 [Apiosordaria backusii]
MSGFSWFNSPNASYFRLSHARSTPAPGLASYSTDSGADKPAGYHWKLVAASFHHCVYEPASVMGGKTDVKFELPAGRVKITESYKAGRRDGDVRSNETSLVGEGRAVVTSQQNKSKRGSRRASCAALKHSRDKDDWVDRFGGVLLGGVAYHAVSFCFLYADEVKLW